MINGDILHFNQMCDMKYIENIPTNRNVNEKNRLQEMILFFIKFGCTINDHSPLKSS